MLGRIVVKSSGQISNFQEFLDHKSSKTLIKFVTFRKNPEKCHNTRLLTEFTKIFPIAIFTSGNPNEISH